MKPKIRALLVHDRPDPWGALRVALGELGVETRVARTCGEALAHLWGCEGPQVVLTAAQLSDGTWSDVVGLARRAESPINVIVVAAQVDVRFYLEALDGGAYDFLAPPFEPSVLEYVLGGAAGDAFRRWNASSHPARRARDRKPVMSLKESSQ
jgi:DNA-binding NtrC family response regulator